MTIDDDIREPIEFHYLAVKRDPDISQPCDFCDRWMPDGPKSQIRAAWRMIQLCDECDARLLAAAEKRLE